MCDNCDVRSLGRCQTCHQINAIVDAPWSPCARGIVFRASMIPPACTGFCAAVHGCETRIERPQLLTTVSMTQIEPTEGYSKMNPEEQRIYWEHKIFKELQIYHLNLAIIDSPDDISIFNEYQPPGSPLGITLSGIRTLFGLPDISIVKEK